MDMHSQHAPSHIDQRRERLYEAMLSGWRRDEDCWIFAYASLLWKREFEASEVRPAHIWGYHRALAMRSRVNRGTHERPGLVFALLHGGSCQGLALCLPREHAATELARLWEREMPLPTYEPRWLPARTAGGTVRALAFTLPRGSPQRAHALDDAELLHILRHARGRYGSTLDYLLRTAAQLRALGIHDARIDRQVELARRHGLAEPHE
jgi:cation transport protein ChaC